LASRSEPGPLFLGSPSEVDVAAFGFNQIGAFTFRSGIIGVSLELLEDSNWPLADVIERVFL
jgi:hypothetical protein